MNQRNFFAELKRRNIYKVAVAYAIVGWLAMQVAATAVPALHLSDGITSTVVLLTILGFPIALVLAWAYELTPEGIKRTQEIAPTASIVRSTGRKLDFIIIAVLALAVGFLIFRLAGKDHPANRGAETDGRPGGASLSENSQVIPAKSIAVLPFESLSANQENAFFASGVQDEILTHLARIADLKVISRTSVMKYNTGPERNLRDIAKALNVAHIVEGSVQRSANRVRVNAQLIDARNDAHLWAETYDRDLADVFSIQSEIAKKIADQLQARISPSEKAAIETQPTKDLAAYDLYVRATEAIDAAPNSQNMSADFLQAIALLEQAIARDPAFLNAYCKLARAHDQLYLLGGDHTPGRLALAEQAINAGLRLQPDSAEAHLALAAHLYSKLDYEGARGEIEIARRSLPNDSRTFELSGYVDRRQGRWAESARNLERALELDPQNSYILQQISSSYEFLREYARDAAALERILALRPNDLDTRISRAQLEVTWHADARPLRQFIDSLLRQNSASEARFAPIRIFLAFAERDPIAGERALADLGENTFGPDAIRYPRAFGEGLFARLKGDASAAQASFATARAEQQKVVDAQPDYGPALCVLAFIDAGLGRKDDALREGRRALELMSPTKDSVNAPHVMGVFAMTCALVGEKDLAIDGLTRTLQLPGRLGYGQLRLFPQWDPLRSDQRFEQIVASLAPKESLP